MKKYRFSFISSAAILLFVCNLFSSCSDITHELFGDDAISFMVVDDVAFSRGTPITNAVNIPNMCVYGYYTGDGDTDTWANKCTNATPNLFDGVTVTNTSVGGNAEWNYPSKIYWPAASGAKVSFFAYSPVATSDNGINVNTTTDVPTLKYTVPTTTANQPDLMYATPIKDKTSDSNPVSFSMNHALTCIGFEAAGYGEVESITISGVSMSGTLSLDGTWSNLSDPVTTTFTVGLSSSTTISDNMSSGLTATNGYLMMIPQTLTDGAKVTVKLKDEDAIEIPISGTWERGQRINYKTSMSPPTILSVSPAAMAFSSTASNGSLSVTCGLNDRWTLTSSETWATLSLSSDGIGASTSVSGTGSQTVYLQATANSTTSIRRAAISYWGSPVTTVTQLPSNITTGGVIPSTKYSYVGAFWKHNQTGERLIRIPVADGSGGDWTAFIYSTDGNWSADDIVLSKEAFPIYPASSDAAATLVLEDTPAVSGSSTTVSGTAVYNATESSATPIYFRIGLKSAFTPTYAVPARYAVVAIAYAGNSKLQLLYLRQGEDPDYLMRPTDGYGNDQGSWASSPNWRPAAKKFSAYNVTASTLNAQCDRARTATNPSKFTAFPSQAGAFFQWAANDANIRFAYPPVGTGITLSTSNSPSTYWDALSSTNETSPQGYLLSSGSTKSFRRPNDGITNAANSVGIVEGSEFRQSLWYSPQSSTTSDTGNSLWGYYADGYFDRLATATSQSSQANSCVNSSDAAVAYVGNLFFNPLSGASLFFPAAGYRYSSTLFYPGSNGLYWSSSAYDTSGGWDLGFYSGGASQGYSYGYGGFGLRPVLE